MLAIHGDLTSFPSDDTAQANKAYPKERAQPTGPKCRTLQAKGRWTMGGVRFSRSYVVRLFDAASCAYQFPELFTVRVRAGLVKST